MKKKYLQTIVTTALAYIAGGMIPFFIAIPPGFPVPVFPSAGISLMVVLRKKVAAVGIWIGASVIYFSLLSRSAADDGNLKIWLSSILIALFASLESLFGAYLIRKKIGFPILPHHPKPILYSVFMGGPLACVISASAGTIILVLFKLEPGLSVGITWLIWWFGNLIGVIWIFPLFSLWMAKECGNTFRQVPLIIPILVSIASTLMAFTVIQSKNLKELTLIFTRESEVMFQAIQNELKGTIDTLYSINGLFNASQRVEVDEFRQFTISLIQRQPGIRAFEWIPIIERKDRLDFEERMSKERSAPFRITEQTSMGDLVPAMDRDEYFPVTYIEPLIGNEAALGFDLSSNSLRRMALYASRRLSKPVATPPIPLVQDPNHQQGILIILPLIQNLDSGPPAKESLPNASFKGFCLGVFSIEEMIEAALRLFDRSNASFFIRDVTDAAPHLLIYSGATASFQQMDGWEVQQPSHIPIFRKSFEFAERKWEVTFFPSEFLLSGEIDWKVWGVLIGGCLFTGFLGLMILFVTGRSMILSDTVLTLEREISQRKKTEEELSVSEERFRNLVESAPDAILIMRSDGVIGFANRQVHKVFGYDAHELKGRPHCLLIPEEIRGVHDSNEKKFFQNPHIRPMSDRRGLCGIKKNGKRVPVEITLSPFTSQEGDQVICIIRDITQRLRYEETLHQKARELTTLYETGKKVGSSLSIEDVGQKTVESITSSVGSDLTLLFLKEKEDLIPLSHYSSSENQKIGDRNPHIIGKCLCGMSVKTGSPLYSSDIHSDHRCTENECKREGFHSFAALPLVGKNGIIGILGIASLKRRDFSEEQSFLETLSGLVAIALENAILYKQLNKQANELENRVKERTLELLIEKERAESADRLKSAFLASMSHELRTPLNSIIGFTDIISQEMVGPLNPEQKKQLGMVNNSAQHLLHLINDILDLSKIESGQLQVESKWFDYPELIGEVQRIIAPIANRKGITVSVTIDKDVSRICSDQRRMKQILINLVNNAVKFTEQGSVTITAVQTASHLITRIIDTGIGIEESNLDTIFKAFRQVETNLARRYEGTGLGLTICQKLIALLRGDLKAESPGLGRGSVFTITLPLHPKGEDDVSQSANH